ncbi:hypothetical protein AAF712_011860 [Marasmius tenuissimus]|uniref:GST N-terminal domain-containing protein n=1 Tax=Marasmius tenuissimus TaxID=585030 RepID=A0ABR2ZIZ1_9AGAR
MSSTPFPHLFGVQVRGSLAELAVAELTQPGEIELKVVDLIKGENFDPEFIKLNPNATLPTLEADGQIYTSTFEVVQYLIKRSGKDVKPGHRELLDKIHEGRLNPNFALLLSKNGKPKLKESPVLSYLADKQPSKNTPNPPPQRLLRTPSHHQRLPPRLLPRHPPPPTSKQDFFSKSTSHFNAIGDFIHDELPQYLPSGGLLLGGTEPSEDDYHLDAWIIRIAATNGAKTGEEEGGGGV